MSLRLLLLTNGRHQRCPFSPPRMAISRNVRPFLVPCPASAVGAVWPAVGIFLYVMSGHGRCVCQGKSSWRMRERNEPGRGPRGTTGKIGTLPPTSVAGSVEAIGRLLVGHVFGVGVEEPVPTASRLQDVGVRRVVHDLQTLVDRSRRACVPVAQDLA